MAKFIVSIFRHRLYLQAQDAQFVHHRWHTVGHHAQVFATNHHTGGLRKKRQFFHRLVIPELVMAAIEIVVIQSVEVILLAVIERLEHKIELHTDARMIGVGTFAVANKEHIADERVQTVSDPDIVCRGLAVEERLYLALRIKRRLHLIHIVMGMVEEFLFHLVLPRAKDLLHHPVGDKGFGEKRFTERQPVTLYLIHRQWQCRRELPQQSMNGIGRYLPDTEEAEDMVDAVSVEILRHLTETVHPPFAMVFQ